MESARVLWINACLHHSTDELIQAVKRVNDLEIVSISNRSEISRSLAKASLSLIIFDFDFPDLTGLQYLQRIKRTYNNVPILMLTNEHSENLAIPVKGLLDRIKLLHDERFDKNDRKRVNFMPVPLIPVESRFRNHNDTAHDLKVACTYIENHIHEKISEQIVAQLCGMNRCEFSRAFKHHHGITFRNYIIDCRLQRAASMLRETTSTVTDVAFSVGFNDLSHFAQLFRRNMHCTPTKYRTLHSD